MRNLKIGSITYMGELLTNYRDHGHWTKQLIQYRQQSGMFLKSVSIGPESIRVKLKRNFFILLHKDGFVYMVDTINPTNEHDKAEVIDLSCDGKIVRAIKLFPWGSSQLFLDRLEKYIISPERLLNVAFNRLSPFIVAKVKDGRSLMRDANGDAVNLVRKSEVSELANAGLKIKETTNSVDKQVMKVTRRG